jgi:hypothetical protein
METDKEIYKATDTDMGRKGKSNRKVTGYM